LSLRPEDLHDDPPMQWVSTGLRYLIAPVRTSALPRARIAVDDFGDLLGEVGALLAYVLDPDRRERRNWVNDGSVEDIATGSASGPAAAYLVRHGRAVSGEEIRIAQGRFRDRPSIMRPEASGTREHLTGVSPTRHVCLTGSGTLDRPRGM
jgi:trans-2,3-dihydro-3-hydroxyanthranilate isomerase